jgi:general secretion pathway protein G
MTEAENRPHSGHGEGFSLLEMMTVITLILILANFATPIFHTVVVGAREATLREELFTLRSQIDRFTHDNERAPASLDELMEKGYMGAIPIDPFTGSNETWQVETQDGPLALDDSAPAGIVEVHSGSDLNSLEGTPYSSW